jgi:O-antigen/teichoic acid export membrane protein
VKLLKHSFYNLIGLGLPLLAAGFTIPILISTLGEARFGLLTLIWAVVSYFGLFDLGLGRALTQQLAILLTKEELSRVGPLVTTATGIMAALGLIAGLAMAQFAPHGVDLINAVPDREEAIRAMYAMALCMPFIVLTSGFRGVLEASHTFGVINAIRLPMGLFTFIGPLVVVLYWQPRLDLIATVLSAGRVVACGVHCYFAWGVLPKEQRSLMWDSSLVKPLWVSGSWLTVSNIISPFMGYADRFIIGATVSTTAVAYYATTHELITKLWIFPGALTAVLFPTFAAQMSRRDPLAWDLFCKAVKWLFILLFPITMTIAIFAHEVLAFWINTDFAVQSAVLLKIFAFGVLFNCLAHVPFTLIQGQGSARLVAIIHLSELPFYILALWMLTNKYGVVGAALAWLIRMLIDTSLMFWVCAPLLGRTARGMIKMQSLLMVVLALAGFTGSEISSLSGRLIWVIFILVIISLIFLFKKSKFR